MAKFVTYYLAMLFFIFISSSTASEPGPDPSPFGEDDNDLDITTQAPGNITAGNANNATQNQTITKQSAAPIVGQEHKMLSTIKRISPFAIPSQNCSEERECKAACGSRADDSQCDDQRGNCLCLHPYGPPKRCRNAGHSEEPCSSICGRKVSQICFTDFGNFCACFFRN